MDKVLDFVNKVKVTSEFVFNLLLGLSASYILVICIQKGFGDWCSKALNGSSYEIMIRTKHLSLSEMFVIIIYTLNMVRFIHSFFIVGRNEFYKKAVYSTQFELKFAMFLPLLQFVVHLSITLLAIVGWHVFNYYNVPYGVLGWVVFIIMFLWDYPTKRILESYKSKQPGDAEGECLIDVFDRWVKFELSLFIVGSLLFVGAWIYKQGSPQECADFLNWLSFVLLTILFTGDYLICNAKFYWQEYLPS